MNMLNLPRKVYFKKGSMGVASGNLLKYTALKEHS